MNEKIRTIEDAIHHPEVFRVAIFGSARTKPEDLEYQQAFNLAYKLGKEDISVITGGGPGQMNASNAGHEKACSKKSNSIGLTIKLPWEPPEENKNLDIKAHFSNFGNRLNTFMALSNVAVITAGGIGTCLELFYTLQLTQVKHIAPIPIILMDPMWHKLMDWLEENVIPRGFVSPGDTHNVIRVNNETEAFALIMQTKRAYDAGEREVSLKDNHHERKYQTGGAIQMPHLKASHL